LRDETGQQRAVAVAIVTMGKPDAAAQFCHAQRLPFTCLSDPGRHSYRAYGLRRGTIGEVMGPRPMLAGLRAAARGHFIGRSVDDVYQLGGVFVVGTDGLIRYARYPQHSGDNPPAGEISRIVARVADDHARDSHDR
jgi:hypothetical protein